MADFTVEGIIDVDAAQGIASVKAFRTQLNGLFADLKKVDSAIEKIDGRTVNIDVDVASEELSKLRADLEAIDDLKATVDLDTTAAQIEAQKLKEQLDFSDEHVGIEFESIEDELAAINAEIDAIQDVQIDIDIDRHKALIQAEKLREEVDKVLKDVDLDVDIDTKDLDKAKADIDGLSSAIGGAGGLGTGGLIAALLLLASTAGPIGGVVAGVLAGMTGPLAVFTAGIASLGIIGIPVFKDIKEAVKLLATDTKGLTPEKLKEYRKEVEQFKESNPNIWEAAQAFNTLQENYKKWSDALRPEIITLFSQALQILEQLLDFAGPIAESAADGFIKLGDKMSEGLKSDDWIAFFEYVEKKIGKFINMWGTAVGNFLTGIANMIVGFDPLTEWFNKGFVGMSEDFLQWSQTFSKSQGFKDFVAFVKENGPLVKSVVGGLITAIINLAKQLAPLGEEVLKHVDAFLDWYNNISKTNPKAAQMAVILGALAIAAAPFLGFLVKVIGPAAKFLTLLSGTVGLGPAVAIFAAIAGAIAMLSTNTEKFNPMMQALKDLWDKIVEVGTDLWEIFQDLWAVLQESGAVEDLQEGMTSIFNILSDLLPILKPIATLIGGALVLAIIGAAEAFKFWFGLIEDIVHIFKPVIDWVVEKFQWLFDKIVGHSIVPDLINGIIEWFQKLPGKIKEILVNMVTGAIGKLIEFKTDAINKAGELLTSFVGKMQELKEGAAQKWENLKTAAGEKLEELKTSFVQKAGEIITGFVTKIAEIKSDTTAKLTELKTAVTGFFSGALTWLSQAGANIVQGLINGLNSMLDPLRSIASTIGGIISDVLPGSPVKEGPLKVLNRGYAGKEIVNMVISGIEDRSGILQDTLNKVWPSVDTSGSYFDGAAGAAASSSTVNNYYSVEAKVPVGTNMAEAGREIAEALDAFEGSGGRRNF